MQSGPEYEERDCGYETPCWVWQRRITASGYGQASWREAGRVRKASAHRIYYVRHVGSIPDGLTLDHLCRNRACVNPAHLEAVTPATNSRRSPLVTKLNWRLVREIRDLVAGGWVRSDVANAYGISGCHVTQIAQRKVWA